MPLQPYQSIQSAICTAAAGDPSALALAHGERTLTYGELEAASTQLAARLRGLGVVRGVVVALQFARSIDAIVAALAVMKAGGAYLPLDPSHPFERRAFQIDDAGAKITLSDLSEAEPVAPEPPLDAAPDDLAYIIYTSGSTGRPKGVEITHGGLANLVAWHRRAFEIRVEDRASHLSPVGFDAAVWEVWPYLAAGASVHIVDDPLPKDPDALRAWLLAQDVTVAFLATPLAEQMLRASWPQVTALRLMLTGADTLHAYPPPGLPFDLVNNYGPTECTVVATSGVVRPQPDTGRAPSIGAPIDGARIYLVDEHGRPGDEGEIWIGGAGVGRGYRNLPDFTARAFVQDPFDRDSGTRLYRTGDLGRRLPDGDIAFLGRSDDQLKVRGFRIEPSEIERMLDAHATVRESAIVARDLDGDAQLVAYVAFRSAVPPTVASLRTYLAEHLPAYMIPSMFVAVPALPLSEHGKIDRRELRTREIGSILRDDDVHLAARTPTEERLSEILERLMKVPAIGVDENFFELGGHSLLATQLIARVRDVFGVELSLRCLFEAPTIAGMAVEVDRLVSTGEPAFVPLLRRA